MKIVKIDIEYRSCSLSIQIHQGPLGWSPGDFREGENSLKVGSVLIECLASRHPRTAPRRTQF